VTQVIFFTSLLVVTSIIIHGLALHYLEQSKAKSIDFIIFAKFSVVLIISHLIHILLFALFYNYSSQTFASNLFGGYIEGNFIDFFYFSISCYTTLGTGDIYPVGIMRIVAGMEALIGLMLIAWTATFKLGYLFKIKK